MAKIEWSAVINVKYNGVEVDFSNLNDDIQQKILDSVSDNGFFCSDEIEVEDDEPRDPMLDYVESNLKQWEIDQAWECIGNRCPIPAQLTDKIIDLCEEYGVDNDLPEGFYLETYEDAEDIFTKL